MSMDFYVRMSLVCSKIPAGRVATYGQIAMLCGFPKNARQVGYGLRMGRAGEELPAHRIVNSGGMLSGAQAFETPDTQRERLEAEGVAVKWTEKGWKVSLKDYKWQNTLEEAEELYQLFEAFP